DAGQHAVALAVHVSGVHVLFWGGAVHAAARRSAQSRAAGELGAGGGKILSGGAFWSMGGYARYVWPCFGFACTVLAWNLWAARRYHAKARQRAQRALAMSE